MTNKRSNPSPASPDTEITAASDAPLVVRAALRTWAREDRVASGEVVLATAQDLIEAGHSPAREAWGLVRTGATLRARGFVTAPWDAAARLALMAIGLIVAALLTTAAGGVDQLLVTKRVVTTDTGVSTLGWHFQPSDAASAVLVGSSMLITLAAFLHRRVLATAFVLATAAMVGVAYQRNFGIGSGHPSAGVTYGDFATSALHIDTHVDLTGTIGLLLFVAFATAAAWAITGRYSSATASTPIPPRLQWLTLIGATAAALLVPTPVGRAIDHLAANQFNSASPAWLGSDPVATSFFTLAFVCLGTVLVAVAARRRRPAAAVAAVIVGSALWIPALWLSISYFFASSIPLAGLIGDGPAALLFWGYTSAAGVLIGSLIIATAGKASGAAARPAASVPSPPVVA